MTAIRDIEEISLNAWPALQTLLCDGWIVRFADGYTKRANSVNPLYPSLAGIDAKIQSCESLYRRRRLPVIFKLTSAVLPDDLDERLQARGYESSAATGVQLLDLNGTKQGAAVAQVTESCSAEWLAAFCRLRSVNSQDRSTLHQMLGRIPPSTGFFTLADGAETVACGMGVVQDGFVGLFDITTDTRFRRRGLGRQLVSDILGWGKQQGARTAYLQVALANVPARRLYATIGFVEFYQYWYRISP